MNLNILNPTYFKHLFTSKGPDRIHSPFIFDLYYYTLKGKEIVYNTDCVQVFTASELKSANALVKVLNRQKPDRLYIVEKDNKWMGFLKSCNLSTVFEKYELKSEQKDSESKALFVANECKEELGYAAKFDFVFVSQLPKQKQFWVKLIQKKEYNIQLDCFYFGICFKKTNQVAEYFRLRF